MNAMQDKDKPKKKGIKPLTFRQLVSRMSKHEAFPSLLKTAAQSGWLSDENFLTRLSDKEQDTIREMYRENAAAKRAEAADLTRSLPEQVGSLVDKIKTVGGRVQLTANNHIVFVDGTLFITMQKRHPEANVFLSYDDPDNDPVIFSMKNTVAILPVQSK